MLKGANKQPLFTQKTCPIFVNNWQNLNNFCYSIRLYFFRPHTLISMNILNYVENMSIFVLVLPVLTKLKPLHFINQFWRAISSCIESNYTKILLLCLRSESLTDRILYFVLKNDFIFVNWVDLTAALWFSMLNYCSNLFCLYSELKTHLCKCCITLRLWQSGHFLK